MMVILALYGFINGYVTARVLKFYGTTDFYFSVIISAFALPMFITGALIFESFFLWISKSTIRFSFKTNMIHYMSWYLLNAVMCFIGAYRGYTKPRSTPSISIGKVPRPIPEQPCYMDLFFIAPLFGFVQYLGIYAEFGYLMESIFRSHIYAMFGFLLINLILQVIVISLISIVQTYL